MDLTKIIEAGNNITLQVTPKDLNQFATDLIQKIISEAQPEPTPGEKFLTTEEVCDLLRITRVTLWTWEKKGVINPVRLGNLKRYRLTDIEKLTATKA
jgi:excisionase family DNA binding protein